MSVPVSNAIMDFAVALGRENLSLNGATIELPQAAWRRLYGEMRRGSALPVNAKYIVLVTPNGDVTVRCAKERT